MECAGVIVKVHGGLPFIGGSANTHALSVTAGPWGDMADDPVTLEAEVLWAVPFYTGGNFINEFLALASAGALFYDVSCRFVTSLPRSGM